MSLQGKCALYDAEEFERLVALYGSMKHLQTLGRALNSARQMDSQTRV